MNKLILITVTAVIGLVGCKSNDMYHWGNYESTLYQYTKNPTAETLQSHKLQLEKIITDADKKNKPVPPGIYFELGMLEADIGNAKRSIELLQLEKSAFPEAGIYVNAALDKLENKS